MDGAMRIKTNCAIESGIGASSAWYLTKAFSELGHELVGGYEADLVVEIDGMPHVGRLDGAKYFFWDTDSFLHDPLPNAGETYDKIFIAGCPEDLVKYPPGTVFLPHAHDPEFHKPYDEKKEFDLVMIGSMTNIYEERKNLVNKLRQRFTVLEETAEPGEDYSRKMSRGKLIFNRSLGEQNIPMRFFEGMAIGTLLHNDTGNLEEFATPHTHFIPYRDERDMLMQAEYYLNHDDEREEIARAAREYVLSKHTYKHRAEEMLSYV
jgi:hypothetical protein